MSDKHPLKNGKGYTTDQHDLIKQEVKMAVDKETRPVCHDLKGAVRELREITPIIKGIVRRQGGQAIWLLGLTVTVLVLAALIAQYII